MDMIEGNEMKIIYDFERYQFYQYFLSAKYVAPLIGLFAVFQFMYSLPPAEIVSSFAIMGLVLFVIMAWVGMSCQEIEPEVSEQLIILRMQSERKYYIGQVLFFGVLSGMVTLLSLCFPVADHYLKGKMLFERDILVSDIIGGILLMFACSFVGSMVGGIFSSRIIRKRALGILLTIFCALVSVTRIGIVAEVPISKYILWIVPPVSDVVGWFSREEYFQMGKAMGAFFLLMGYGIILAAIKVELYRIRKF